MLSPANRKEFQPVESLLEELANPDSRLPADLKEDAAVLKRLIQADSAPIPEVKLAIEQVTNIINDKTRPGLLYSRFSSKFRRAHIL